MYKVYHGGGGPGRRVEERVERPAPHAPPSPPPHGGGPLGPLSETLRAPVEALLQRVTSELETEDLILLLIVYLLYRESGEEELLVILGALLLL